MQRIGHFQFGLDRRVVNTGDAELARSIETLWESGQEVRGGARLWANLYRFVLDLRASDESLDRQILIIRYEDLCNAPDDALATVFDHAGLELSPTSLGALIGQLSQPTYYRPDFTSEDEGAIREETHEVAALCGYTV